MCDAETTREDVNGVLLRSSPKIEFVNVCYLSFLSKISNIHLARLDIRACAESDKDTAPLLH